MKKILGSLEKFGRGFLVPVSILPLAGLLLAIGSGFSSDEIQEAVPFLAIDAVQFVIGFLQVMGKATFDNLPIIFAVGLAVGLSKKQKGTAAVAGIVGYTTFIYCNSYVLEYRDLLVEADLMTEFGQKMVLGKQVYDVNVLGGIIVGMIATYSTSKFIDKKLPESLSFFEGPRMVPFVSIFLSGIVGLVLAFVWPTIQAGISDFSIFLAGLGAMGAFFYGFLERLLIPIGLHHTLNAMLKFTELGGSIEACGESYYGYSNVFAGALDCSGYEFTSEMTKFYGGQFITKMFSLPGAALAMYHATPKANRSKIKSLLLGAVIASFLTGITEPLEFTFLFVAPPLYFMHAFFSGLGFLIMYVTDTVAFSIQGAGFINFVLYDVLNTYRASWFGILWIGPMFFTLYYFSFKYMIIKFDFKTPGRDGSIDKLVTKKEARDKYNLDARDEKPTTTSSTDIVAGLIQAHGGADNIAEVDACITRLRIRVLDKSLVDKDMICNELAAKGVTEVGDQIQSIYGRDAKYYKNDILAELGIE